MKRLASSDFISKLYKSRSILLDILAERGFNTEGYINNSINEINIQFNNNQLDMLVKDKNDKKIYIKYHLVTKIRNNNIYEYIEDLYNLEEILSVDDDLLIIVKDNPNDSLITLMNNVYNTDNIYFNIINMHNLQYNILKHDLVPHHKVLTDDELDEVKKKYNLLDNKQFPEISRFDAVAQLIGLRPGQACEIDRPSKTAIVTKYYRLCY